MNPNLLPRRPNLVVAYLFARIQRLITEATLFNSCEVAVQVECCIKEIAEHAGCSEDEAREVMNGRVL